MPAGDIAGGGGRRGPSNSVNAPRKDEQDVMQMNESLARASGAVQRQLSIVGFKITRPNHLAGLIVIRRGEIIMLKTISAAVVAVSLLAVPAMANTTVIKKSEHAPVTKSVVLKKNFRNANNKMIVVKKHHRHHHNFHRHYR
jgi:hypothetical protein